MWPLVLISSLGCYVEKLLGLLVPARWVQGRRTAVAIAAVPVALLAALTAIGTVVTGTSLTLDARLAGLAVAAVFVLKRRGFLVVLLSAITTTALVRLAS